MRSMTGCGTGAAKQNGWEVTVEVKSVNHRFLDIGLRLPRTLSFLEPVIRSGISAKIKRGHIETYVTVKNADESSTTVSTDVELARTYYDAARRIAEATGAENNLTTAELMKLEGVNVLSEREMDQELISGLCAEALEHAMDQLVDMRTREGAHLQEDLKIHLEEIAGLRNQVSERAPMVVTEYRDKLNARIKALNAEGIDPQRLAQEVALMADRCAIDEELARLESHLRQMDAYIHEKDENGKKMDFLIQEMNRETNTIGSKASDLFITQRVVSMKSEIEKMREQIQNVE
ncbi:MAG: YicC family protein [Clostridia bacterium]|nr:YicC family protein [Clostridia bacterium]